MWDIHQKDVRRLLRNAEELELSDAAVQRLKWFDYLLRHGGNISLACRHFGIARSTLLRWLLRFRADDAASLEESSRRPKNVRAPQTETHVIEAVKTLRKNQPNIGRAAIQELVHEAHGIMLSLSTIGRIISRHKLFFAETEAHKRKREAEALMESAHDESDRPFLSSDDPPLGLAFDIAT